jgi:1-acyl-sn-glycerol-3-phosphate acyltransferase
MIIDGLLVATCKALVGAYPRWLGNQPDGRQRLYFANHASHLDTLALWSALPPALRRTTRPVAARDYWGRGGLRGLIAEHGLNAVLIDRLHEQPADPLQPLDAALQAGDSLILFPEGTRNAAAELLPFKTGLYHLAQRHPDVELVPVYLDNARRSMPKGSPLPVPLICTVRFGAPFSRIPGEDKNDFLDRARHAVERLRP